MIEVRAKNNTCNRGRSKYIESAGDLIYVPIVDGKELNYLCETEDVALIVGLGYKYDGANSRFATMACRMLKIDSNYAQ